jgi:hypothetical protein
MVRLLLPPDASPQDREAFICAAAWLAQGLALVSSRETPTPLGSVLYPIP